MKKKLTVIFTTALLSFQTAAFSANCLAGFNQSIYMATNELAENMAYCDDTVFSGPCQDEADAIYNGAINSALNDFEQCCCENDLDFCCG